jgi:hypothetical protein
MNNIKWTRNGDITDIHMFHLQSHLIDFSDIWIGVVWGLHQILRPEFNFGPYWFISIPASD